RRMRHRARSVAKMRKGKIKRISKETQIQISLTIEGRGRYQVSTGIRFFDHMLELFAHHGGFDLKLKARGDLDVDQHHTVEDVGIVLGQAFDKAPGTPATSLVPWTETWEWPASISAGPPPPSSIPKAARASSAICNPSWSM